MKQKIKFDQLLAYGAGGIVPIALFNITGQLMGLMGNISLGLSAIMIGFIMLIPRLWDAFSDTIMGYISDKHKSPKGRRRPFILYGGIAVAISFVLMWWVPRGENFQSMFPSDAAFQWFQLAYILVFLLIFYTSCTVFEIPHGALGMELSHDPDDRTKLFSAKSFMGNLFAMGTPWLFFLANLQFFKGTGNEIDGMRYVSILVAIIVIPLSYWSYKTLREPDKAKESSKPLKIGFFQEFKNTWKNKSFVKLILIVFSLAMGFNFVGLLGYYIPIYYIFSADKEAAGALLGFNGMLWGLTGLLAVFPLNMISHKLGKKSTLFIAIIIMIIAQVSKIFCYNPNHPYLIMIPTVILSIGMSFFFTLGAAMVGDICDENTVKTGHANQGSYYSIYWWFIKLGTAFASIITGFLINSINFDETQIQKAEAITKSIREIKINSTPSDAE